MEKYHKVCLIDGDIILYYVAFACENEDNFYNVEYKIYSSLNNILNNNNTPYYIAFLSDNLKNNFRISIDKEYKNNRKDKIKPKWYYEIKDYLINKLSFQIINTLEADDCLSIYSKLIDNNVICSIDKDLLQIEGVHYNLNKQIIEIINKEQARLNLWMQVLTGDPVDNIKGIEGIGKVKALKLLKDNINFEEISLKKYIEIYGEYLGIKLFYINYNLVKLLDHQNNTHLIPNDISIHKLDYTIPIENYIGNIKID